MATVSRSSLWCYWRVCRGRVQVRLMLGGDVSEIPLSVPPDDAGVETEPFPAIQQSKRRETRSEAFCRPIQLDVASPSVVNWTRSRNGRRARNGWGRSTKRYIHPSDTTGATGDTFQTLLWPCQFPTSDLLVPKGRMTNRPHPQTRCVTDDQQMWLRFISAISFSHPSASPCTNPCAPQTSPCARHTRILACRKLLFLGHFRYFPACPERA